MKWIVPSFWQIPSEPSPPYEDEDEEPPGPPEDPLAIEGRG